MRGRGLRKENQHTWPWPLREDGHLLQAYETHTSSIFVAQLDPNDSALWMSVSKRLLESLSLLQDLSVDVMVGYICQADHRVMFSVFHEA